MLHMVPAEQVDVQTTTTVERKDDDIWNTFRAKGITTYLRTFIVDVDIMLGQCLVVTLTYTT